MKRRAWLVVAALVLVLLASCGGDESPSTTDAPAAAATTVTEPTDASEAGSEPAEPTAEPTVAPKAEPEPTVAPQPAPTPAATTSAAAEPASAGADVMEDFEPVAFVDNFGTSVAPIFANKCASCHNVGGPGASHWSLSTAADIVDSHLWINGVVDSRYMPPWPVSDLSAVFHDNRSLRPDEIAAIAAWSAAGAPLDVDATTPIVSPSGSLSLDADVEIGPHEPFQGSTAVADDYRCLIYDLNLSEPAWMKGYEFVPDQTEIVHHAIGYLAPQSSLAQAQRLSAADELGGWQCYGSSGLSDGDELFLGWAPGQLPTEFPDGSGLLAKPGDFIVVQIHYHFDTADAPEDASTMKIDWADEDDLDPIEFDEFLAPAEIPCSSDESGPLCDRDTALLQAYEKYGVPGVLADGINQVCGVTPEDFALMTNGTATSSCTIPVRNYGEIVSVFGHQHEIGKSIRMTLNAGQPDEKVLFDIPDWSFDWQLNYYLAENVVLERGDSVLLECEWDRSRRKPGLEPAYVLWADGTNDEMCFATIATRGMSSAGSASGGVSGAGLLPDAAALRLDFPDELVACMADAGFATDRSPLREEVDEFVDQLFVCEEPAEVGRLLSDQVAANFGGLVGEEGITCLAEGLSNPQTARSVIVFTLEDSEAEERLPVGELVGDCVSLSAALAEFGFAMPESIHACIDEAGRELLAQATVDGELPEEQTLFRVITPCLAGE